MGSYGLQHAHRFRTNLEMQTPKVVSITTASTKVVVFLKIHQNPILMIDL